MTISHVDITNSYLSSTQSVLYAGKELRNALNLDRAKINYAITRLEKASQQQETGGRGYRAFMFSELEGTKEKEKCERVSEDILVSIITDIQTANLLMAAGQTVGETGTKVEPQRLDEAILRLENTTNLVQNSLSPPLAEGAQPGRFGFSGPAQITEAVKSSDIQLAIENFRRISNETLKILVNEAEEVINSVIKALDKLDTVNILDALSKLGGQLQVIPKIGRLFRQGLEKLEAAINALFNLLGSDMLAGVRNQVKKIYQDVKEGKYTAKSLEWAFGVEATRSLIEETLDSGNLGIEPLDNASKAMADLTAKFRESMGMIKNLVAAIAFAGSLLFLITVVGNMALIVAFSYLLIFAGVVLIGMDYADSGIILQRVRGVREIASSVKGG